MNRAPLWGKENPIKGGKSPRGLGGFPVPHFFLLLSRKVGCLVSITVTCTFLKSNRFLWVGGSVFCGIGAARLTQRLSRHPQQLTLRQFSLMAPDGSGPAPSRVSPPAFPGQSAASPIPLPRLSPSQGVGGCMAATSKASVSLGSRNITKCQNFGPPPDAIEGGITKWHLHARHVLSFTYVISFDKYNCFCILKKTFPTVGRRVSNWES